MSFRILLVDDSRLVRAAVSDMLGQIEGVEVYGEAVNGQECLDILAKAKAESDLPDLIIMDIEMPVLDGISTLKEMKKLRYDVQVLMLSVLTVYGALSTFRAMDLGAIDFLPKPSPDSGLSLSDISDLLRMQIERLMQDQRSQSTHEEIKKDAQKKTAKRIGDRSNTLELLVIGVSTGGPPAIQRILEELPKDFPVPILVIQHMPAVFTKTFAERLNELLALRIGEASEGDVLEPARVYIAPGDFHLELRGTTAAARIHLSQEPPRFSHRPSVDVTMQQAAELFGASVVGLIMTGMGQDGVLGMQKIHEAGGVTLAQDEKSSVIFGMNRRAIEAGVVQEILPLDRIPPRLIELCTNQKIG